MAFYNHGGDIRGFTGVADVRLGNPLNLSEAEINDLVEFLGALEGAPVAAALVTAP